MEIKRVFLIGMGSMGSFFAPRLHRHLGPEDFRIIAGGERRRKIEERGFKINGDHYDFTVVSPDERTAPPDLIICAVKSTAFDAALDDMSAHVAPHTQIMCIQNGIGHEERAAKRFGEDNVLFSFMRMSINMEGGVSNYDESRGAVYFGERKDREPTERVRAVKALFDAAGIRSRVEEDMDHAMWFKFMCNIGENMTCALLGIPFGVFRSSEGANFIRHAAMHEVMAIANRLGIHLTEDDIARQDRTVVALPPENEPSTLFDLKRGRRTEIDIFSGEVVRLGRELGIPTPVNEVLYNGVRVLEERRAAAQN